MILKKIITFLSPRIIKSRDHLIEMLMDPMLLKTILTDEERKRLRIFFMFLQPGNAIVFRDLQYKISGPTVSKDMILNEQEWDLYQAYKSVKELISILCEKKVKS